jgi:hypothetical protein
MIQWRALCALGLALMAGPAWTQDANVLAREIKALSQPPVNKPLGTSISLDGCEMRIETVRPDNSGSVFIRTTLDLRHVVIASNEDRTQLGLLKTGPSFSNPNILRTFMIFATNPGHHAVHQKKDRKTGLWNTKQERIATFAILSKTKDEPETLMHKLTHYAQTHCQPAPQGAADQ